MNMAEKLSKETYRNRIIRYENALRQLSILLASVRAAGPTVMYRTHIERQFK